MTEAATQPVAGTHLWVNLMACDLAASRHFYGELLGWQYEAGPPRLGPYVRARCEGRQVAGLGEVAAGGSRVVAWLPYIATDDADATAARVRDCGGTVAVGPLEVEGVGRLAIAADVSGAAFGLWQGGRDRRAPLGSALGAPVWNELVTHTTTQVTAFYRLVFGYRAVREPGLSEDADYLVLRLGERRVAGLRGAGAQLPAGLGPHWLTYFSVADVDGTVRHAEELGARVTRGPLGTPLGRLARLSDPEGAPFGLVQQERDGRDPP